MPLAGLLVNDCRISKLLSQSSEATGPPDGAHGPVRYLRLPAV